MMSSADSSQKSWPLVLLVPRDAVALHERDEVLRRVARERRAAEVRVVGQEVGRPRVAVREVAAAAARDADLLAHLRRMVDEQHARTELAGDAGAEEAGGAGTDDDGVEGQHGGNREKGSAGLSAGCCGEGTRAGQAATGWR